MQLANFFWILLIAAGIFFLFFVLTAGYMLRKEKKSNRKKTVSEPEYQAPAPLPEMREFVITQEQPLYYNTGQTQSYPPPPRTQENYRNTYENYIPQPVSQRRTAASSTSGGRTTGENHPRFVIMNSSPEIRFR